MLFRSLKRARRRLNLQDSRRRRLDPDLDFLDLDAIRLAESCERVEEVGRPEHRDGFGDLREGGGERDGEVRGDGVERDGGFRESEGGADGVVGDVAVGGRCEWSSWSCRTRSGVACAEGTARRLPQALKEQPVDSLKPSRHLQQHAAPSQDVSSRPRLFKRCSVWNGLT